MTTFTTQDRIEMEKLLREQAEQNSEPVPFFGWIQHSDDTVTRVIDTHKSQQDQQIDTYKD